MLKEVAFDNEDKNKALLVDRVPLTFGSAFRQEVCFALPFAVSRLILAMQNLGYSIFIGMANIANAVAASSSMFMIQRGLYGFLRGWLSTTAVVVGTLNGEGEFSQVGPAVNQGLLSGTVLGVLIGALLFFSGDMLLAAGTSQGVAEQAGGFLRGAAYSVIPANWAFLDQIFLLSIKHLRSAVMFITIQVVLSLAIGIPWSYATQKMDALGYGIGLAALITFVLDRVYFLIRRKTYAKYQLFARSFKSGTTFGDLICLSFPTGLQAVSEWLPTALISILIGALVIGAQALNAIEPAMELLLIINTILLGLGTAATVSTANAIGEVNGLTSNPDQQNQAISDTKTIGRANILLTVLFAVVPAAICLVAPNAIAGLFLGNTTLSTAVNWSSSDVGDYSQQWFGETVLRMTGATFLIDGIRNTATGLILGRKRRRDNFITALANLLVVSGLAAVAAYFSEGLMGPVSYFAARLAAVLLMAIGMYAWWEKSKDVEVSVSSVSTLSSPSSTEELDHSANNSAVNNI